MHRIGQKKSVKIYRLITTKTYEQHMFHRASLKLGLEQAVMDQMRSRAGATTNKKEGFTPEEVTTYCLCQKCRLCPGCMHEKILLAL